MKVFIRIFIVFLFLVFVLLIGSLFVPREFNIERSITIDADVDDVEALILSAREWNNWSVWNDKSDSTMHLEYEGPQSGVGSKLVWYGDLLGTGTIKITDYSPGDSIEYVMNINNANIDYHGTFHFSHESGNVKVTWNSYGKVGWNPTDKLIVLVSDDFLGQDLENGLSKLKKLAETQD